MRNSNCFPVALPCKQSQTNWAHSLGGDVSRSEYSMDSTF